MGRAQRLNKNSQDVKTGVLRPKPPITPTFTTLRGYEGHRRWETFKERRAEETRPVVAPIRKGKRKPTSNDLVILRGEEVMPTRDELLDDIVTEVKKVIPENEDLTADTLDDVETVVERVITEAEDTLDEEENEEVEGEAAVDGKVEKSS